MNIETATTTAATTTTTPTSTTAPKARPARSVSWARPPVDVWESQDELVLTLDVPGVLPEAFEIRAEGASLTVQGVRVDGQRGWHRVFTLPPTIDAAQITAKAENGVLTVTLPRAEAAKPRRITVR